MFVKCIVPKLICLYEGCPVIGSIRNIVVLYVNYVTKQCLGFCTFSLKILGYFFFLCSKKTKLYHSRCKGFHSPWAYCKSCVERGGARHLVGPTCTLTNSIPIKVHMFKTSYSCVTSCVGAEFTFSSILVDSNNTSLALLDLVSLL